MRDYNHVQPAFPCEVDPDRLEAGNHQTGHAVFAQYGMALRDYFAAKAMQGLACSDTTLWPHGANDSDDPTDALFMARTAYMIADAMLEARGQQP